jgi:hypothetical protein
MNLKGAWKEVIVLFLSINPAFELNMPMKRDIG